MLQPPLAFFGITVYEPVTVLTDIILSLISLVFAFKTKQAKAYHWALFFMTFSAATFIGALGHGMYDQLNNNFQLISRMLGIISVFFACISSAQNVLKKNVKYLIFGTTCLQTIIALLLVYKYNDFRIVSINGIVGFVCIVTTVHFLLSINKKIGSGFILSGILVNALAGIVHQLKLTPHQLFNHNDVSHIIMIFGLYLFFKGAIQLQKNFTIIVN